MLQFQPPGGGQAEGVRGLADGGIAAVIDAVHGKKARAADVQGQQQHEVYRRGQHQQQQPGLPHRGKHRVPEKLPHQAYRRDGQNGQDQGRQMLPDGQQRLLPEGRHRVAAQGDHGQGIQGAENVVVHDFGRIHHAQRRHQHCGQIGIDPPGEQHQTRQDQGNHRGEAHQIQIPEGESSEDDHMEHSLQIQQRHEPEHRPGQQGPDSFPPRLRISRIQCSASFTFETQTMREVSVKITTEYYSPVFRGKQPVFPKSVENSTCDSLLPMLKCDCTGTCPVHLTRKETLQKP